MIHLRSFQTMSGASYLLRLRACLQPLAPISRSLKSTPKAAEAGNAKDGQTARTGVRCSHREKVKAVQDIPGPSGLPYLGTMLEYRLGTPGVGGLKEILTQRYRQFGGLVREKVAGRTRVHVFDPEHVQSVYKQEGKWPQIEPLVETTQLYRQQAQHSPGLGNTNGEDWYRLRSAIHQVMMRPREVAAYVHLVDDVASDFVQHLEDLRDDRNRVADFAMEVSKWNLESAVNIAFEDRKQFMASNSQKAERWIEANTAIMRLAGRLRYSLPWHRYVATPTWKRLVQAEEYLTNECQIMVDEALTRLKSAEERHDLKDHQFRFLRALLSSAVLKDNDITTLVLSLMTDGLPSTAPTVVNILYCLATNPRQQERLHEEVTRFARHDAPLTHDVISKMSYLKACIKETLRLFPVTLEISRVCPKDVVIGDYRLPEGTCLKLNSFVAHRDPSYFPDPNTFRPEMWLRHTEEGSTPEREELDSGRGLAQPVNDKGGARTDLTNHPYRYIPFGHGPRMCPGRRFAEQDMHVVTARLVQRFHVQWHGGKMGQRFETLMRPDCPLDFTFHPRPR